MVELSFPLTLFADASAVSSAMKSYIVPVVGSIIAIASVAVVFFLVNGGIQYMTSSGNPEKLEHAKLVIRNALIGLAVVIAAATLTAILSHAYSASSGTIAEKLPTLTTVESPSGGFTDLLLDAIVGLLKNLIDSAAKPFLAALAFFTNATPLMADNSGVFNLWLAMVGLADVLFILVVALLGFHVMSYATFGLEEVEFKHMLPRLALIFLLINTSIFAVDAIIGLSNGMISALQAGFPSQSVWDVLKNVTESSRGMGLAALLIMVVFLVLTVMLLVYYLIRLVVLYIGAVLAPVVLLVWLLPAFKDFAESAMKTYIMTIFVLFVHVVILQLAASIFAGMAVSIPGQPLNPIMAMLVGVATVLALLKTQGVMAHMSYASLGPRTARKLGGQIANVISYYNDKKKSRGDGDEQSDGLSRRGSGDSDRSKSRFYKSETAVLDRNRRGGPNATSTQNNNYTTNNTHTRPRSKNLPPQTRVAPKIGKADKK